MSDQDTEEARKQVEGLKDCKTVEEIVGALPDIIHPLLTRIDELEREVEALSEGARSTQRQLRGSSFDPPFS